MLRRLALLAVVVGCSSSSATPEPTSGDGSGPIAAAPTPAPAPKRPVRVARDAGVIDANLSGLSGRSLYTALCAPCHGRDARGYAADHAPSLISTTFLESASDDYLHRSISTGRPGTTMAAYDKQFGGPLDAAGIDSLVAFLREQGPPAKALPAMRPGDANAGAKVYADRCKSCHGDTQIRGEAVTMTNAQFQLVATDAFLRYAITEGRPGTRMASFKGTLSDADIDNVVAYIRSFTARTAASVTLLPEPTGKEPVVINPKGKAPRFQIRSEPCPAGSPKTCKPDPRFVAVAQVAAAFAAKQRMVIIDARAPSEWRRVHIPGAVSIPYHDLKRLDEIPKDAWIIAYCGCPHHLSGIVVDELRKRGYQHALVLDEGINDWHRRGFPVVAAEGVTKPLAEPTAPH